VYQSNEGEGKGGRRLYKTPRLYEASFGGNEKGGKKTDCDDLYSFIRKAWARGKGKQDCPLLPSAAHYAEKRGREEGGKGKRGTNLPVLEKAILSGGVLSCFQLS